MERVRQMVLEEDVRDVVAALSEFAAGVVPGMSLFYREFPVRESFRMFDSYCCDVLLKAPRVDLCVLHEAHVPLYDDSSTQPNVAARIKLMGLIAEDGWPAAASGPEMRLKLAAGGAPAFRRICERYAKGGYQRVSDFYNFKGMRDDEKWTATSSFLTSGSRIRGNG